MPSLSRRHTSLPKLEAGTDEARDAKGGKAQALLQPRDVFMLPLLTPRAPHAEAALARALSRVTGAASDLPGLRLTRC